MSKLYITYNSFTVAYSLLLESSKSVEVGNINNNNNVIVYYGDKVISISAFCGINVINMSFDALNKKGIKCSFIKSAYRIKHYMKVVNYIMSIVVENDITEICLYKDNSPVESTVIEKINKSDCKITLIEEGLGLYQTNHYRIESILKLKIKRVLFKYYGLSMYSFEFKPQGQNDRIDIIYCHYPELLKGMKCSIDLINDDFTINSSLRILQAMYPNSQSIICNLRPKYVFLTQPLTDISSVNVSEYMETVKMIISCLDCNENILIKKHPADKNKYEEELIGSNVLVLDDNLSEIPFQLMYIIFGKPITISFYSSTSIYVDSNNDFVIFKVLKNKRIDEIASGIEYVLKNSNICHSVEDFYKRINNR